MGSMHTLTVLGDDHLRPLLAAFTPDRPTLVLAVCAPPPQPEPWLSAPAAALRARTHDGLLGAAAAYHGFVTAHAHQPTACVLTVMADPGAADPLGRSLLDGVVVMEQLLRRHHPRVRWLCVRHRGLTAPRLAPLLCSLLHHADLPFSAHPILLDPESQPG